MLSQFARTLVQRYAVGDVLYGLGERVLAVVGIEGAGVSLADADGKMRFATAINEPSAAMEQAQEHSQRGPCIDAFELADACPVGLTATPAGTREVPGFHQPIELVAVDASPDQAGDHRRGLGAELGKRVRRRPGSRRRRS